MSSASGSAASVGRQTRWSVPVECGHCSCRRGEVGHVPDDASCGVDDLAASSGDCDRATEAQEQFDAEFVLERANTV